MYYSCWILKSYFTAVTLQLEVGQSGGNQYYIISKKMIPLSMYYSSLLL